MGDILCQNIEGNQFDWRRCTAMTVFGGTYMGVVVPKIYSWYPRIVRATIARFPPKRLTPPKIPFYTGTIGSFVDNFIHVPFLYIPTFFISTELLRGQSIQTALQKCYTKAPLTLQTCWAVWIPLQIVNFGYVPRRLQVLFTNVCNLGWNVILDYTSNC